MKNLSVFFFLFYSTITFSQNVDINILKKINLGRNKNMDNTFIFISNSITPVSVLTPVSVFFEGYSSHDSLLKNRGLYIGASLLLSTGITLGLKYTVNRPRPFVTYPEIENITHVGSKSFPSGHTSTAFSTATSLSFAFPKWYVIAPSFAWACAVEIGRAHV